jgi:serine protease
MAARYSGTPFAPKPVGPGRRPPGNNSASRSPWRDIDPPAPTDDLLARHGALVLDPVTALRLPGDKPPRPTVYIANSLILPRAILLSDDNLRFLATALDDENVTIDIPKARRDIEPFGRIPGVGVAVELVPVGSAPTNAPDAWAVLQRARGYAREAEQPNAVAGLGLNHLLFGYPHLDGHPVEGMPHLDGHSVDSEGLAEYGLPGSGGRAPVSWVGARPRRRRTVQGRRPVVAVLDTGCGDHPWLAQGVIRTAVFGGLHAELTDPTTNPEITGDLVGPMDGSLDTHSGHGTFISGLIRQISPDADILALRIMASDGVVQEGDLLQALSVLAGLVERTRDGQPGGIDLDVISLSLGYYHEAPADLLYDPLLRDLLQGLAGMGVCTVACAGNDATTREVYPAAFAPHPGGEITSFDHGSLPVISVGALNPDGSTALFSNGGDWVLSWEVGAAVVSTLPVTFNGGAQPSVQVSTPTGRPRRTIDPDSYAGGFGTWSGTSFSAPVLAARLARHLTRPLVRAATDESSDASVDRMWTAIEAETELRRPT